MIAFRSLLVPALVLLSSSLCIATAITAPDTTSIINARQAVAAPRAAYASSLRSAHAATALTQFRSLYAKVLDTHEELERELAWLKKCRKDQRDAVGASIHDTLFQLLTDVSTSSLSFHFATAAVAVASASPSPGAARSHRRVDSDTLPDEAARALSHAVTLIRSTTAKVVEVMCLLPEQLTSIDATLEELEWELNSLVEGSEQRLPGILQLSSLSLSDFITANATLSREPTHEGAVLA